MGRPRKYHTEQQRNAAKKLKDRQRKRMSGKYWRLVIPAISQYGVNWTYDTPSVKRLKASVVDLLVSKQRPRGLDQYLVAVERHPGSGKLHLDILLTYFRKVRNGANKYDYLIKHGNLTRYRTVNAAILDYNRKQDPSPLGNLDTRKTLRISRVKTELYDMMQQAMLRQPFTFDAVAWLANNGLMSAAVRTNMFKIIRAIKARQNQECNRRLQNKPGIREITPQLIRQTLSKQQYQLFKSWPGYQRIVEHINLMTQHRWARPHKTRNLFVVGRPNTGKTTLGKHIARHCSTYPVGVDRWFPEYKAGVYHMLIWNEFNLRVYRYDNLLKLLEGEPMKLPVKGGHVTKHDNPLIYMTSNMDLHGHICSRFKSSINRNLALSNLSARIEQIIIPANLDLFLMLKLIMPV